MNAEQLETRLQNIGKREGTSVPATVAERIELTLAALPDRSAQRRTARRRRAWAALIASAAIVGGSIAGYSAYNQEGALENPIGQAGPSSEIPIDVHSENERLRSQLSVYELRESIRRMSLKENSVSGAGVSDQGIHVRLGYIVNDGYALAIRYSITSDQPIKDFNLKGAVRLDGQTVGYVGQAGEDEGEYAVFRNEYTIVSSTQYEGVLSTTYYPFEGFRMQYTDFELAVSRIGTVDGEWEFDVDVRRQDPSLVIVNPQNSFDVSYGLNVSKVSMSKVSTRIDYTFKPSASRINRVFGIELEDDTGYRYGAVALRESANGEISHASFPALNPEANSLLIRPVYWDWKINDVKGRADVKSVPTPNDPLVVPIGEDKELIVTAIERRSDRTVVRTLFPPGEVVGFSLYDVENGKVPVIDTLYGKESGMVFGPVESEAKLQIVAESFGKSTYVPELEVRVNLP
ncbi:hypothetical protein [Cohnella sp.]|uniref:hypothetical protein n=1 Tax=Cohnella sp. TaxID=1883426 RepID=UPI003569B0EC